MAGLGQHPHQHLENKCSYHIALVASSDALVTSSFLFLVGMPRVTSSFLLLVVMSLLLAD